MASASEWACKPGTRPQVLSMMPPEWFVLLFLIVLWRPSLPHTMKQRAIVAQVWPLLPSEHAKSVLASTQWNKEQSLLKYGLRLKVSMQARHSSSGAVNDASGMIRTFIPHSLVKAFLASHNETKSNRCSSMASASEWPCEVCPCLNTMEQRAIVAQVWPLLPSEHAKSVLASTQWNKEQSLLKYGLCFRVSMQSLSLPQHNGTKSNHCSSMASSSEWACEVCPCLNTMEQRAIVALVWPPLPSEHAKSVLASTQWNKEQSLP